MRLGVNIDHIATVRQARRGAFPSPIEAARVAEQSGATSIICHLREDRRHIQDEDVRQLRKSISSPLNLEMSIANSIVRVALKVRPDTVTFVPERREELTTEGGLDVRRSMRRLKPLICDFQEAAITVSLFVDPKADQLKAAKDAGVHVVELNTGSYSAAKDQPMRAVKLKQLKEAASLAASLGLEVAAGHGLSYENVVPVVRIPQVVELNIGYSIVSRALFFGFGEAVREMRRLIAR